MIVKAVRFSSWEALKKEALRLQNLGYICEVKGWDDMRNNKLTIKTEDKTWNEQ